MKVRLLAVGLVVLGVLAGYFVYPKFGIVSWLNIPLRLGLDLKGGVHLTYRADVSKAGPEALEGIRDVIERRINIYGVSEPVVRTEQVLGEDRLSVQLAGVFNVEEAIQLIGETPLLEFRIENPNASTSTLEADPYAIFLQTELTGQYLKSAKMEFDQTTGVPYISIQFDDTGAEIFERITGENIGKTIAIFLDGAPISVPVVRDKISGGSAQITGQFTLEEARTLARRLNSGALPVPIELISQERVEPAKGAAALTQSFFAGIVGFLFVIVFMIIWYRLPGLVAVVALLIYVSLSLSLFKLAGVTLTTAGIAGFVLSIGMAVDANILIFERMKEELRRGKTLSAAVEEGFVRAWTSVRDSNISSLITAFILWYFGTESVKGFALTLGLGIVVSMFSAIVITRTFLRAIHSRKQIVAGKIPFFYSSGFGKLS